MSWRLIGRARPPKSLEALKESAERADSRQARTSLGNMKLYRQYEQRKWIGVVVFHGTLQSYDIVESSHLFQDMDTYFILSKEFWVFIESFLVYWSALRQFRRAEHLVCLSSS